MKTECPRRTFRATDEPWNARDELIRCTESLKTTFREKEFTNTQNQNDRLDANKKRYKSDARANETTETVIGRRNRAKTSARALAEHQQRHSLSTSKLKAETPHKCE